MTGNTGGSTHAAAPCLQVYFVLFIGVAVLVVLNILIAIIRCVRRTPLAPLLCSCSCPLRCRANSTGRVCYCYTTVARAATPTPKRQSLCATAR